MIPNQTGCISLPHAIKVVLSLSDLPGISNSELAHANEVTDITS